MTRPMRSNPAFRCFVLLVALGGATLPSLAFSDVAGPPITWTLSASPIDPWANSGGITSGILELYLWALPIEAEGWEASCFGFATSGAMTLLGVTPIFGVQLDDGCIFAIGCPPLATPAATVLVLDLGGEICFTSSPDQGTACTVDCHPVPQAWENSWIGYTSLGTTPCSYESWAPCMALGVELDPSASTPWGRIKAEYR